MKRFLTKQEEFEIMKLVLDKFLWLGVIIMAYGFYRIIRLSDDIWYGFAILLAGAILMLLFMWILVKEYDYVRK
jgi:hypothetical protein